MEKGLFSKQETEDFNWLFDHYGEWMAKHPDKWIAVYKKSLVAVADNATKAGEIAKERLGNKCTPVVAFVEGGAYVY